MASEHELSSRDESFLDQVTQTLLGIANASFQDRASRDFSGDPWDTLAFLANSTADEVQALIQQLQREREELKKAQAKLVQAEKLAALGRLAASVAHEMNQPLTVLRSMVEMVRLEPEATVGERAEDLELIEEASRQLTVIVDSVRRFGMGTRVEARRFPADQPLQGALQLLGPELDRVDVRLRWRVPHPVPALRGNPDRLRQVFINLFINARDAMIANAVPGPLLSVELTCRDREVVYRVSDNGPGVSEELERRLFEPFFSTKQAAEGTGLGLSVVHGIVQEHGGTVAIDHGRGPGASFVVRIPRPEGGP